MPSSMVLGTLPVTLWPTGDLCVTCADGLILNLILAKGSASHGPESPELSLRGNRGKSPLAHVYFNIFFLQFKALLPVADFILGGSKITADSDCSHEIKRCLLLGRKVMTNLDNILKSRDITLPTKVCLVKTDFASGHVWM